MAQYIGSATGVKERFQIYKSDIITGKIRYRLASHLYNVCQCSTCETEYLQVQLIEHVFVRDLLNIFFERQDEDADKVSREREKYCQG